MGVKIWSVGVVLSLFSSGIAPGQEVPSADRKPSRVEAGLLGSGKIDQDLLERVKGSTVLVKSGGGTGSGFGGARDRDAGYLVVTSAHVVRGETATVIFESGESGEVERAGTVLARDEVADLCVIGVQGVETTQSVLDLSKESVIETQRILAIGFPFGEMMGTSPSATFTSGRVSSLRRIDGVLDAIQIDADVNPGNSGGPVIDDTGAVIGVVTSGLSTTDISFLTPAFKVRRIFDGYAVAMESRLRLLQVGHYSIEIDVRIVDPLKRVSVLGFVVAHQAQDPAKLNGESAIEHSRLERVYPGVVTLKGEFRTEKDQVQLLPYFESREGRIEMPALMLNLGEGLRRTTLDQARTDSAAIRPLPQPSSPASPQIVLDWAAAPASGIEKEIVAGNGGSSLKWRYYDKGDLEAEEFSDSAAGVVWERGQEPHGLYLAEKQGFVWLVDVDGFNVKRSLDLTSPISSIHDSAVGIVAVLPALQELVVMAHGSLEPRAGIYTPDISLLATSPDSKFGVFVQERGGVFKKAVIWVVDLSSGVRPQGYAVFELFDAALGANSPGPHGFREVKSLAMGSNGENVFVTAGDRLLRLEIDGDGILGKGVVSDPIGDVGRLVANRSYVAVGVDGNSSNGAILIFSSANLGREVLKLEGHGRSLVSLDEVSGRLAFQNRSEMGVISKRGRVEWESDDLEHGELHDQVVLGPGGKDFVVVGRKGRALLVHSRIED